MNKRLLNLKSIFVRILLRILAKIPITVSRQRVRWHLIKKQAATNQNRRLYLILKMLVHQKALTVMYQMDS